MKQNLKLAGQKRGVTLPQKTFEFEKEKGALESKKRSVGLEHILNSKKVRKASPIKSSSPSKASEKNVKIQDNRSIDSF